MNSILKSSRNLIYNINKRHMRDYSKILSQGFNQNRKDNNNEDNNDYNKKKYLLGTAVGCGIVGYSVYYAYKKSSKNKVYASENNNGNNQINEDNQNDENNKNKENISEIVGKFRPDLPIYSSREVSKHVNNKTQVWVTYKEGVYNITEFVDQHPGGDQILIAAGSALEPFWNLYAAHQNDFVYEMLEEYRIGNLKVEDVMGITTDDPYAAEPVRHPILKPTSQKPFNAEVPPSLLVASFITPNELFYVRNHLPVPEIDAETYELEVEIEGVGGTKVFTLDELKKMPKKTITATIMCAGNRRGEMTKIKPVKGLNWGMCAVGTAKWTGVPLCYILKACGVKNEEDFNHVQFEGYDGDARGERYGASIPIWRAMENRCDVLLAYEMNGVPIPRDHGFPVRVIVPGIVGARNVKWLERVVVSKVESCSHWQQNDYKCFSPSTDWDTVDFKTAPAIQELPITSAICVPSDGEKVKVVDGHINLKGYAWSGGGLKIIRVDLTADGGKTWLVANLDAQDDVESPRHWAWTLWSAKIPVQNNQKVVEVWVKAVDSNYNTQPESFQNIWNLRGVLGNAYHRIKVELIH